jgi:hypothetical protein
MLPLYPSLLFGSVGHGWTIIKQDARSIAQPLSVRSRGPMAGPPFLGPQKRRQSPSRKKRRTSPQTPTSYQHRAVQQRTQRAYPSIRRSDQLTHTSLATVVLCTRARLNTREAFAEERNPPGFYAIERGQLRQSQDFEGARRIFKPEPHHLQRSSGRDSTENIE